MSEINDRTADFLEQIASQIRSGELDELHVRRETPTRYLTTDELIERGDTSGIARRVHTGHEIYTIEMQRRAAPVLLTSKVTE